MCVRIVKTSEEIVYSSSKPIEEQVEGCNLIVIDYNPKDASIGHFFSEIQTMCKKGKECQLNIKVLHNDHLPGARISKAARQLEKDFKINDIIKLMATSYYEMDRKLEELTAYLKG